MAIEKNGEIMAKAERLSRDGESTSDALIRALDDALGEQSGEEAQIADIQEALLHGDTQDVSEAVHGVEMNADGEDRRGL